MINVEKATKESIAVNNWDTHFREIVKRVDEIATLLNRYNARASINGGEWIGQKIYGKLSELEAYIRESKRVFLGLRKYRKVLWDIMREERKKKK